MCLVDFHEYLKDTNRRLLVNTYSLRSMKYAIFCHTFIFGDTKLVRIINRGLPAPEESKMKHDLEKNW